MSISHTAAFIAIKLYGLTRERKTAAKFDPFIIQFYERLLLSLPKHLRWYHTSLKSKVMRSFFIFSEEILLPGDLMHILCRKFYVGQKVKQLIDQGYKQIVNVGAGFDHLGANYSIQGIPVFELDLESMIKEKKEYLESENYLNNNLQLLTCDVEKQRIAEILSLDDSFEPLKKTIFLAEGFFDYMDLIPTKNLIEDIQSMHPKNKLVTTFFSLDELNGFHRWVFKTGVSMVGESLKFNITRNEFVELLEELGMELESEINHSKMESDFVKNIGINLPVMKGFYVQEYGIK